MIMHNIKKTMVTKVIPKAPSMQDCEASDRLYTALILTRFVSRQVATRFMYHHGSYHAKLSIDACVIGSQNLLSSLHNFP